MKLSNPPMASLGLRLWGESIVWVPIPPKMQTPLGPVKCPIFPAEKAGSLGLRLWEEPDICGALTVWAARRMWEKQALAEACIVGATKRRDAAC